ncbi:unnamed protein product [Larinioides sclopetarius]|uniref:Uncharacterized protein n=1 Tax=Larinioides sclopetarius TaxID=280406 RepID=A0AAV1Z550_9ARAC
MKEAANDVVDKLQNLTVKDDEVEEEFKKDFGSRLRLVKGALLIQEIGNQLHCSIISIAKAQVLFHQFQRLKKNAFNTVYLYKFLAQLHSLSDVSEVVIISMSSTATKLLSTYYLCEGCLDFNADEIAIACLQFTFLYCGVVVPSVKYLMKRVKQL